MRTIPKLLMLVSALAPAVPAWASAPQTPQDRADPSVVEEELRERRVAPRTKAAEQLALEELDPDAALTRPVLIRTIRLEGAVALPASAYAPAVLPYKNRRISGTELQDLATAVAEVARAAGYGLASAWIPEQTIEDGFLTVIVDEGRIDDVRVDGDAAPAVRPFLERLASGAPVRTDTIERALLLAGDLPGVDLIKPRIDRVGGSTLLIVNTRREAVRGRASVDNWGSGTIGPVRAHLSVDINGLLAGDDRLTIAGVSTPLAIKEFGLARIAYAKAIGTGGTELSVSGYAARSRPGGILSDREFEGQSLEGTIGINHPFLRSRDSSLWGEVEFSVRDSEQSLADVTVRKDRFAILKAGGYGSAELLGGLFRGRVTGSRGLGILDATRDGDPMRSRRDGSAIYAKLEAWAHYERPLGGPLSMQLQAEGQVASRPLLSSEEMGLGGRYFLRGYDYREYSGDKGIAGSVELRFQLPQLGPPFRSALLYGYADAGTVGNYGTGAGGGSLASAGGGIRARLRPELDASLEVGVPLKDGDDPDESYNPRISFVIGSRF